ncbi:MAG: DUF4143 domain-containing protein, partial [Arcobacteraceae bacterium]|nr:DUF4143 domain-containing protein [Arcobacteraceae bacterium]
KLLENLVFCELQKRGFEVYYYQDTNECDFIAIKEDKKIAIQVCYELGEQNQKRELNGLIKLPFEVDEKTIITYNQNKTMENIEIISFYEYFWRN